METITVPMNSELSANSHSQLEHLRDEIKTGHTTLLNHCIMLGKRLSEARELAQSREGGFLTWVKEELGWSRQYAYNYINVFETFGELPDESNSLPIGLTAAIALGRPSTPQEARDEAIKIAESGKPVNASTARDIIKKHKEADPDRYPEKKTGASSAGSSQFGDGNSKIPATETQAQHAVRLLIKRNYDNNQEAIAALGVGYPDKDEIARICQEIQGENSEFKVGKALAQGARDAIKYELQQQVDAQPEETFSESLNQPLEEIFQAPEQAELEPDTIIETMQETINSLRAELQSKDEEIRMLRTQLAQMESV